MSSSCESHLLNEYYTCLVEKHHSYYIEKRPLSQAIPAYFLIKSGFLIFCTSKSEVMHELSTFCYFSFFSLKKQHFSQLSTISYPHFFNIRILKKSGFCYTLILKAELSRTLLIFCSDSSTY